MKLRVWLLGITAFLLAMVAVMPVAWVKSVLPDTVQCAQWSGSIWRGRCSMLTLQQPGQAPLQIESLQWKVHALALLRLQVRTEFKLVSPQGQAEGLFERGAGGALRLRDVSARAVLDRRLVGALPAGWNGQLDVRGLDLQLDGRELQQLAGELVVHDFNDGRGGALGNYQLKFPAGGAAPFQGQLRDDGGPLETNATLTLSADRSWVLDGTVAVRAGGDPALHRRLDLLGAPDAAGRRRLSAAGSIN